jgi:hypothetical protein
MKKFCIFILMAELKKLLKIICATWILASSKESIAQNQRLVVRGVYTGKDIYWIHGTTPEGIKNCLPDIRIKNSTTGKKYHVSENPIELKKMADPGDSIVLEFEYSVKCTVKIANRDDLFNNCKSTIKGVNIDTTGIISWSVDTPCKNPIIIRQFKWNKWVEIQKVEDLKKYFDARHYVHSGLNKFRIDQLTKEVEYNISEPINYKSNIPEVICKTQKITDFIEFDRETFYELYDTRGNMINKDYGKKINCKKLPLGQYFVSYDNKTIELKKE